MSEDQYQHDGVPDASEVAQLLWAHADATAERIIADFEGGLSPRNLEQFLASGDYLRYPTSIVFDASPLEAHQFAEPVFCAQGSDRSCRLHVRPVYARHAEHLPYIVAYMAAVIMYGDAADADLCEHLGAMLMQETRDVFYERICAIADLQ
jgi:hypothetical protein